MERAANNRSIQTALYASPWSMRQPPNLGGARNLGVRPCSDEHALARDTSSSQRSATLWEVARAESSLCRASRGSPPR
jgi:hypothetical protein